MAQNIVTSTNLINMEKQTIKIFFDSPIQFEPTQLKQLNGIVGIYFIFTQSINIQYPFSKSRLIYIGMSEKKTNSIGNRLSGHYDGTSKNLGLTNYRKVQPLMFTYLNFEILKSNWKHRIEDLESYFIMDFVNKFGVYPICNNKSGFEIQMKERQTEFIIDWNYFN